MSKNSKPEPTPDQKKPKDQPKKRRRWPWIVGAVVVLLLLFVLLLPTLASTGIVRRIVQGRINKQLNGTLEMKSWSLGWFSGFKVYGLKVADAQGETVAEVESIIIPASVFDLLGVTKKLGDIEVAAPKLHIVLQPDGTTNLDSLQKPKASKKSSEKKAPSGAAEKDAPKPLGFDVIGSLAVRDGDIRVTPANGGPPFTIENLNVQIAIAGLSEPIAFDVSAAVGDSKGALALKGNTTLAKEGVVDPEAVKADVKLALTRFDLASANGFLGRTETAFDAKGVANIQFDAHIRGQQDTAVQAEIVLAGVDLSGDVLKGDHLRMEDAGIKVDIAATDRQIEVKDFNIHSPFFTASAAGAVSRPQPDRPLQGALAMNAELDLPKLAAQLPNTLSLQKGLTVTEGTARFASKLETTPEGPFAEVSLRIEDIEAVRTGETPTRLFLSKPVVLDVKARSQNDELRVDTFDFDSSFAQMSGRGSAAHFQVDLKSDLAAAMQEARKFLDLGALDAHGRVMLTAAVSGPDADAKSLKVTGILTGFRLAGVTPKPVALDKVTFDAGAKALLATTDRPSALTGVRVAFASPVADVALKAERILSESGSVPVVEEGQLTAKADLDRLIRFAQDIGSAPEDMTLQGEAVVSAEISAAEGAVTLAPDIVLKNVRFEREEQIVAESEVRIKQQLKIFPAEQRIEVANLAFTASFATLNATGKLTEWATARHLDLSGERTLNFDRLGPLAAAYTGQPITMAGTTTDKFHIRAPLGETNWRQLLRQVLAEDELEIPQFAFEDIKATNIRVPLAVEAGHGTAKMTATLNKGSVNLPLHLDATADKLGMTLPADTAILDKVAVTQSLVDRAMVRILPVLKGGIEPGGTVSLVSRKFDVPLEGDPLQDMVFEGEVHLSNLSFTSAGVVQEVLDVINFKPLTLTLPDQRIGVSIKDGRAYQEEIRLQAGEVALVTSGSVGLKDKTLQMVFDVPVTPGMLKHIGGVRVEDKLLREFLKDEYIRIEVTGTLDDPKIEHRDVIQENLQRLFQSILKKALTNEAGNLLQDLLNR